MEFQSANPTIVKSIKQRDLLNTWLRLYAREQQMPRIEEYQPSRLADELPDLVYYTVDADAAAAAPDDPERRHADVERLWQHRQGPLSRRISRGPARADRDAGLLRMHRSARLPVYTISNIDDIYGRIVAYERLLLPFSEGGDVTHVIASLKTISEDGGFEIRNLMRGNDTLPTPKLRAVIDRDLFHRAPGRIPAGDVIEFS